MRSLLQRLAPVLQLTRVTTAFAAVANTWFVILWTRVNDDEGRHAALAERPLWILLLGGAVSAVGLYAFGATLNDFLDAHRDRALGRDRPLAAGRASPEVALSAIAGSLIASALGATVFGTPAVIVTLLLGGCVLVFNAVGRFVPAIGFVLLSVIYAGHMLVPNLRLRFLLPVWLVMTHALVIAGVTHWLARKTPAISRRALAAAIGGWAVCSLVLLEMVWRRSEGDGLWPWWVPATAPIWPAFLALVFAALAARRVASLGPGPRAADKIARYGALWLPMYACAWLFGAGKFEDAALMGALALAGLLGMTALREAYNLLEHPVAYRR